MKVNLDKQKEAREKRILRRKKINEKVSEEKDSDSDSTVELSENDEIFDTDVNELLDSFDDEKDREVADPMEVVEAVFEEKIRKLGWISTISRILRTVNCKRLKIIMNFV